MTGSEHNISFGISRKSLEAVRIHACPHCGAPGVYRADDRTKEHWPGCWEPHKKDRPVGEQCPNCGGARSADKNLGEVTASMPRWIWNCILGIKWCVIQMIALKHRIGEQHG
jgi:hypothetical protein